MSDRLWTEDDYDPDCWCFDCKAHTLKLTMATGGTPYIAGPEEVTTKTIRISITDDILEQQEGFVVEPIETTEDRNKRIWQAIKDMSLG